MEDLGNEADRLTLLGDICLRRLTSGIFIGAKRESDGRGQADICAISIRAFGLF